MLVECSDFSFPALSYFLLFDNEPGIEIWCGIPALRYRNAFPTLNERFQEIWGSADKRRVEFFHRARKVVLEPVLYLSSGGYGGE